MTHGNKILTLINYGQTNIDNELKSVHSVSAELLLNFNEKEIDGTWEQNLNTDKLWTNVQTLDNELKCIHSFYWQSFVFNFN